MQALIKSTNKGLGLSTVLVFRMELSAEIPFFVAEFHYFHQLGVGIDAHAFHAGSFKSFLVVVVEFKAVAMSFLNMLVLVGAIGDGILVYFAIEITQAHGTDHIGDAFLFIHQVDDIIGSIGIEFGGGGILQAQYVTGEFYAHALHTQPMPKVGRFCSVQILRQKFYLRYPLFRNRPDQ